MAGRRRDQRFLLSVPWEGALRLPTDVVIERCTDDEVWVLSPSQAAFRSSLTVLSGTGCDWRSFDDDER